MAAFWKGNSEQMTRRENVAELLAFKLECYSTDYQGNVSKEGTIRVVQHKQKFGSIRVYCSLADILLVKQSIDVSNRAFSTPEDIHRYRLNCLILDAKHYRDSYLQFKELFPDLWLDMFSGADYPQLLCENSADYQYHYRKDHVFAVDEMKADIRDICGWPVEPVEDKKEK